MDPADPLELTAPQARVLGALMEKQLTTPDSYPLTLNALTSACNQSSNREPITDYPAQLVETTVHALKSKKLARIVHPGAGERATKYRQVAEETLGLDDAERALLCVLLLRGAQTVNELRTRTERLHPFGTNEAVEAALAGLTRREPAFVAKVDRQPGQKEDRWIELLQVDPEGRAAASSAPPRVAASAGGSSRVRLRREQSPFNPGETRDWRRQPA